MNIEHLAHVREKFGVSGTELVEMVNDNVSIDELQIRHLSYGDEFKYKWVVDTHTSLSYHFANIESADKAYQILKYCKDTEILFI